MSIITVKEYLESRGYEVCSSFFNSIDLWHSWYLGDVSDFHRYEVYTGQKRLKFRRFTLGMGKQLCEDWANILFNEQADITIDDDVTNDFIHAVFDESNAWERINQKQEEKMYAGTVAYLPSVDGMCYDATTGRITGADKIKINYVTGENIIPLTVDNGNCVECAFTSHFTVKKMEYTYLQMCLMENGLYKIENHLFEVKNGRANKIDLESVPKFASIAPVFHTESPHKPYAIDKPALANHVLPDSVYGVSVFANAIHILKGIDIIFDSYINEFILGKKRIIVTGQSATTIDGKPVFDPNDVAYYQIPEDMTSIPFLKEIDMRLRSGEHQTAMNDMLQLLSTRCGFGPDNYKYSLTSRANAQTATEIVFQNQTKQQVREKHVKVVDRALKELVRAIISLGVNVLGLPLDIDAEITIQHDDAIVEGRDSKLKRMREDAQLGYINPLLYLMEAYQVSAEQAAEMMPNAKGIFGTNKYGEDDA